MTVCVVSTSRIRFMKAANAFESAARPVSLRGVSLSVPVPFRS